MQLVGVAHLLVLLRHGRRHGGLSNRHGHTLGELLEGVRTAPSSATPSTPRPGSGGEVHRGGIVQIRNAHHYILVRIIIALVIIDVVIGATSFVGRFTGRADGALRW